MKSEKTLKITIFHWVTVSKPFGQNRIKRYLWKDNIHIFNLTPSGSIYPQYFCHTGPFYKQGPTKKWENGELSVHIFSRPWHLPHVNFAKKHSTPHTQVITSNETWWSSSSTFGYLCLQFDCWVCARVTVACNITAKRVTSRLAKSPRACPASVTSLSLMVDFYISCMHVSKRRWCNHDWYEFQRLFLVYGFFKLRNLFFFHKSSFILSGVTLHHFRGPFIHARMDLITGTFCSIWPIITSFQRHKWPQTKRNTITFSGSVFHALSYSLISFIRVGVAPETNIWIFEILQQPKRNF